MIKKITINGFRSLQNFEMDITSGLNILIGPNGAGKTNIILFFEFLSKLTEMSLVRAISTCGGIGLLFQRVSDGKFVDSITCKLEGEFQYRDYSPRQAYYKFEFEVRASSERDEVFFASQKLKYRSFNLQPDLFSKKSNLKKDKWDLVVSTQHNDLEPDKVEIEHIDFRKIDDDFFRRRAHEPISNTREAMPNKRQRIETCSKLIAKSLQNDMILPIILSRFKNGIGGIVEDMVGGEIFNIIPSEVRKAEDAATPSGINRDGSGLASTLYSLKRPKGQASKFRRSFMRPLYYGGLGYYRSSRLRHFNHIKEKEILELIIEQIKLVNDQIINLDVTLDHSENQLKIMVTVKNSKGSVQLPFSLLSDGTIKWIALLTAIFTHSSIFAIEEPENFIHPHMQQEIIKIMRSAYEANRHESFVLLTSHSETLLNAAKPSEIILVSMENGATSTKRPENQDALKKEMSRSGFGLGHFYLSGALSYV